MSVGAAEGLLASEAWGAAPSMRTTLVVLVAEGHITIQRLVPAALWPWTDRDP